jgi:hypothetical protein
MVRRSLKASLAWNRTLLDGSLTFLASYFVFVSYQECTDAGAKNSVPYPINARRPPNGDLSLVRWAGLEPARLAAHDPQPCLSANSSTSAILVGTAVL